MFTTNVSFSLEGYARCAENQDCFPVSQSPEARAERALHPLCFKRHLFTINFGTGTYQYYSPTGGASRYTT